MDLKEAYNRLNFWINKNQGVFLTMPELDSVVDGGQLTYYKNCFIKYGTGQRLNDALAPFKKKAPFTTDVNGLLTVPDDYMDLIDIEPIVASIPYACPVVNDDERTYRLKSQVIPLSVTVPFAEEVENWNYQLYPKVQQSGNLTYFSRPPAPKFVYTVVSGRVIVYNQAASTQLLWGDDEIYMMLACALESVGINMSEQDIQIFAATKVTQDLTSNVRF